MVKLYDPDFDEIAMYETTSGRWVKKSDYAALKAENKRLKREIEILRSYGNTYCTAIADRKLEEEQALNSYEYPSRPEEG